MDKEKDFTTREQILEKIIKRKDKAVFAMNYVGGGNIFGIVANDYFWNFVKYAPADIGYLLDEIKKYNSFLRNIESLLDSYAIIMNEDKNWNRKNHAAHLLAADFRNAILELKDPEMDSA